MILNTTAYFLLEDLKNRIIMGTKTGTIKLYFNKISSMRRFDPWQGRALPTELYLLSAIINKELIQMMSMQ